MDLIKNINLFQTVFNSSPNGIAVMQNVYNADGKIEDFSILLFNAYTFNWIGTIDYEGKRYSEIFPTVRKNGILEKFIEVAESAVTASFESWYDGEGIKKWFRFTAVKQAELLVVTTEDITEKKQSDINLNQALADAQRQKRLHDSITNNTPDLVYVFSLSYKFIYANKALLTMWGKTEQDSIGRGLRENGYEEWHAQMHEREIDEVVATKKGVRGTVSFPHAELGNRIYDYILVPVFDEHGEVEAIAGTTRDITDIKRSEDLLQESEARFRNMIEQAPVAILVYVGEEMILREANERMLEILGRDTTIIGKPIMDSIPILKKTDIFENYSYVLASGETYQVFAQPIELIKDGASYFGYYDYTYKPLFGDNGTTYGVICIAVEVTDQVYARQKQQEAEAGLRGAVELAQLGTWSIDVATNGLIYSDRLISWFGFDPSDKDYNRVIPVLAEEDQERVATAVAWALNPESGGVYDEIYTVIHPKTGLKRILHAQGKTVFDVVGNPIRMNGTAQDITLQHEVQTALEQEVRVRTEELAAVVDELEKTNENLEKSNTKLLQSNEELAQFAYIASHDLQEPLRKIITFSNLLETSLGENKTTSAQNYMDKIMHSTMRMRSLISDVLNYSQLAKSDEQFKDVDLNEIVEHIILDYDLLIEQKNARINLQDLPVLKANRVQMTQLFRNLIGNALKFTQKDRNPVISVSAVSVQLCNIPKMNVGSVNSDFLKIQIKDNGIGFQPEYFERIFNIFQRLHSKTIYEGTGIGLAMCKKIVQNHGGDIYAESTFGEGATFTILIPVNLKD